MIINSLLDTDLYKYTMMQCVFHRYNRVEVEYEWVLRTPHKKLGALKDELANQIDSYCNLRFTHDELEYLSRLGFFKQDFVAFLKTFTPNRSYIHLSDEQGQLALKIKGPWLQTIVFEVPLLAMISELYMKNQEPGLEYQTMVAKQRLAQKIDFLKQKGLEKFVFFDFGTRRRQSFVWQEHVLVELTRQIPDYFSGTSNLLLAKALNLSAVGTMAHEFVQAFQALVATHRSQRMAFETWEQEYRGKLAIALSDTIGLDAFIKDFDLYLAKLYDGVRQDSGDPFHWAEKIIAHYERLNIDPKSKTLVFSDALNFEKATKIHQQFASRIQTAFGIGTYLTNDGPIKPLDMVIKMVRCDGQPVAKLSDSPEKTICKSEKYLNYLRKCYTIS